MPAADLAHMRRRLLRWYQRHRRDLPWRRTTDPYAIWISETMLQQTQVATVIPYYHRFMRALPTVAALRRAPLAKVLALWSGLGYYRRAENLKKSARILAERHRGQLPSDYQALRALPGIGEYTAGALLSIAFAKPYPAIDGNVRRVLGRIFRVRDEIRLRQIAQRLVSRSNPGAFNQSLMELGSTLCTPVYPHCAACPVESLCAAQRRRHGVAARPQQRPKPRSIVWPLAIVRSQGKLLLQRRAGGGILSGLWELPGDEKTTTAALLGLLKKRFPELPESAMHTRRLGELTHSITNRRIRAPVFLLEWQSGSQVTSNTPGWRWIAPAELWRQPTSAMTRKALKLLYDYEKSLV
jgi:A/G-specific adenine glycosylase